MDGNSNSAGFELARRVAVLAGGVSPEREVSIASGRQVAVALSLAGYQPVIVDTAEIDLASIDWDDFDLCFIALHGGAGEDGRIQAKLESLGVPYTGSGSRASKWAMRKSTAKEKFLRAGVPTLPFHVISAKEIFTNSSRNIAEHFGDFKYPLVVKPNNQGSSLGVGIARCNAALPNVFEAAATFDTELLIEPLVEGREFTISLLGRDPLPIIEIMRSESLFTYRDKYSSSNLVHRFESGLPGPTEGELYRAAIGAAESLRVAGLVRVDLMLDSSLQPWVLEVNAIPGMTQRSLAPKAASAAGIDMPALVDWMVREALHRAGRLKRTHQTQRAHISQLRAYHRKIQYVPSSLIATRGVAI